MIQCSIQRGPTREDPYGKYTQICAYIDQRIQLVDDLDKQTLRAASATLHEAIRQEILGKDWKTHLAELKSLIRRYTEHTDGVNLIEDRLGQLEDAIQNPEGLKQVTRSLYDAFGNSRSGSF